MTVKYTRHRNWMADFIGKKHKLTLQKAVEDEYPMGMLSAEDTKTLNGYFKNGIEHCFDMGYMSPDSLPTLTKQIERHFCADVDLYYGYYGCGPVAIHDDIGTELDCPNKIPFVILLKYKEMPAYYKAENSADKYRGSFRSIPSFDCFEFFNGENGRMWRHPMVPGDMVVFDPCLDHGIMTSMGYYLLCGLLKKKEKENV